MEASHNANTPTSNDPSASPSDSVAATAATPPVIVLPPAAPTRRRFLTWLGWSGFLVCGLLLFSRWSARQEYFDVTGGIRERFHSGEEYGRQKVAVISVRGVIMDGDGFVKRQIDRVREDPQVKAIVLRVDSPGGTVSGSDYIYHHLKKLREERGIPLVVSMGSIAASGGYYVSMAVGDQERAIFAEPATTTGSIGVIVPHYDLTGLLARFDVRDDSISSHPRKQILSPTREMSEEDREIIQAYVNEAFAQFKDIVKSGRPKLEQAGNGDALMAVETGRDLATGEIFTARQALAHGLVDEIGYIEDAIDRAIGLARLDKSDVRVIQFRRPPSLLNLVGSAQAQPPGFSLDMLFELSAPRAFYLATSLPPLVTSRRE